MRPLGQTYREAEATTDFKALPPGGYVVVITDVIDHPAEAKPYLEIVFDISEGENAFFYADEWGTKNPWSHTKRQYYNEASMGAFKGFLKTLDDSNGTRFAEMAETGMNEKDMVNKLIGFVVGAEEYEGNNGSVRTRLDWFHCKVKNVRDIRSGNFEIPELKKLESAASVPAGFAPVKDSEIPFY